MQTESPSLTHRMAQRRALLGLAATLPLVSLSTGARAQTPSAGAAAGFVPQVGQQGKDVIWVPTPDALVDRMLKMAQVTPDDFVVDLGSGDGKIVIAAARDFKARALGVEFNPDMVALARRKSQSAGVEGRARFEQGDIFTFDYSTATVVTMYLLPGLNLKLRPQLLRMRPGTRLVTHQFTMGSWEPDDSCTVENRPGYLWIVPAAVGGAWKITTTDAAGSREANLSLNQTFQQVSGTHRVGTADGRLRGVRLNGDVLNFEMLDERGTLRAYAARVSGDRMEGNTRASDGTEGRFVAVRTTAAPPVDGGRE